MFDLNIVKLDLRLCKSIADCRLLREDHNINEHQISDEKLWSYKDTIDVFLYDTSTFNIIGVIPTNSDKIQFTDDFINFLTNLSPLSFKKRKLDLDDILDKISSMGFSSLNTFEKNFLKKF